MFCRDLHHFRVAVEGSFLSSLLHHVAPTTEKKTEIIYSDLQAGHKERYESKRDERFHAHWTFRKPRQSTVITLPVGQLSWARYVTNGNHIQNITVAKTN